jgi:hypothetical protein
MFTSVQRILLVLTIASNTLLSSAFVFPAATSTKAAFVTPSASFLPSTLVVLADHDVYINNANGATDNHVPVKSGSPYDLQKRLVKLAGLKKRVHVEDNEIGDMFDMAIELPEMLFEPLSLHDLASMSKLLEFAFHLPH